MPKLRNAGTDIGKFTQWLGRKCRNHHPLEELQISSKRQGAGVFLKRAGERKQVGAAAKKPDRYKAKSKGELAVLADEDGVLLYTVGERTFEITVREIEPELHEGKKRVAVGY